MNEEMMFKIMSEEYIINWMEILLNKHGLSDEEELTAEQIKEEIEEESAVIANECLWNIKNNVKIHEAYLEYLKELLEEKTE